MSGLRELIIVVWNGGSESEDSVNSRSPVWPAQYFLAFKRSLVVVFRGDVTSVGTAVKNVPKKLYYLSKKK